MRRIFFPLAVAALLGCTSALAQKFPAKPVRLIVPFPAGLGALDLLARGISQRVSENVGQPVIVGNRTGASGALGVE